MTQRRSWAATLLLLFCSALGFAQEAKPIYTVEAVRYATLKDFSVAGLVAGADKSRKMDIAMVYWLVQGNGRNILVDAGFLSPTVLRALEGCGLSEAFRRTSERGFKNPKIITDVIITHMHWDHAGWIRPLSQGTHLAAT